MQRVGIVYWEEEGTWLGYLQEYPDYWTQGETLDDLQEHLRDLYKDVTSGQIPVRLERSKPGLSMACCHEAIGAAPLRPKMTWDSLKAVTREP